MSDTITRVAARLVPSSAPLSLLLATRDGVTVASGQRRLSSSVAGGLAADVADLARHGFGVAGAIPLDPERPVALVRCDVLDHRPGESLAAWGATSPVAFSVVEEPGVAGFTASVRAAQARIASGELTKVVLSRSLRVDSDAAFDPSAVARKLAADERGAYVFAVDLGDSNLVGASPELVMRRRGGFVRTMPLAGSRPRHGDFAADAAAAEALVASAKDQYEHALVVERIAAGLAPLCTTLDVPARPRLVATATMWHLATPIVGRLVDPTVSALQAALAIHPTPAVCGVPADAARQAIRDLEAYDRGLYTGLVGWQDAAGDGEWVLALRCAELAGRHARLYAGAGIVAASDPVEEAAETRAKFATMLRALGAA